MSTVLPSFHNSLYLALEEENSHRFRAGTPIRFLQNNISIFKFVFTDMSNYGYPYGSGYGYG